MFRAPTHDETMSRILVIDDDPDLRVMLAQILTAADYEVIVAADGQDNGGRKRGDTQEGDPCDLCFIVSH